MPELPLMIVGAGGHARVLVDALQLNGVNILGILDADVSLHGKNVAGVPVHGGDEVLAAHATDSLLLVNGIGSIGNPEKRMRLFVRFKGMGYRFATVIHPRAIVARGLVLGEGVQVMAGAVLQTGTELGDNVVVNTAAVIDHDCRISAHCFISPGCNLGGGVELGEGTHAGLGCTVLQYLKIGRRCLLAAGAVVVRPVEDGRRVRGVPARSF